MNPPDELGSFCKRFSGLNDIFFSSLKFSDIKKLEYFLVSWKLIPQQMKVVMTLNLSELKTKALRDCLTKYVKEAKIRGKLEMNFEIGKSLRVKSFQGLGELSKAKSSEEKLNVSVEKELIRLYR